MVRSAIWGAVTLVAGRRDVMGKKTFWPLVAVFMVIAVNAAANLVPIGGYNTGELSAMYPTGFTPAGRTFGIWSLIYLGLLTFGIAAWAGATRTRERIAAIRTPFFVNAVGNAAWIFVWHHQMVALSLVVMLVILATLIIIFRRLRTLSAPTRAEFFAVDGVFSLYFGWITAATLLNFGLLFFHLKWYPFGLTMNEWALVSVCTATAIYVWMGAVTRDVVYCLVFVWAGYGIWSGTETITPEVRLAALTGIVAVAAVILWALFNPWRRASLRGP